MGNTKHTRNPPSKKIKKLGSPGIEKENLLALVFILVISVIAYLPVFRNGFVNWDESLYIQDNPLIRTFNLKDIFSTYQIGNYHPLTMLFYAVEYHVFGLSETGYHTVNLLIHLANIILVYHAIQMLSENTKISLLAALLFGIHPLHVESVAWAAELKDLLYAFFFLLSLIGYIKYIREARKKYLFLSLMLFLLSLLSKAMAASLPVVLLLTDYFLNRKFNFKTIVEKLPYFALSIIFGIIAVFAQKESGATDIVVFPFAQRIIFAGYGFIMYLMKLILPINLSAYYPYPVKPGQNIPGIYYLYALLAIGFIIYLIYSFRKNKKIFFGLGFFSITVFLVLQFFPVGGAVMADRYSYIPSIGIFYLFSEGLLYLWNKQKSQTLITSLLGIAIIFFAAQTYSRTAEWENGNTLWTSVIKRYPDVAMAYSNRGLSLAGENKFEEAIADLNKVVGLNPEFANVYLNRGLVLMYLNKYDDALKDFTKAIQLKPDYAEAYNNRGMLYKDREQFNESISDYDKAIELNPRLYYAYNNKGYVELLLNKYDEALVNLNKAISINPQFAEAYDNRGAVYSAMKKNEEAMRDFNDCLRLQPGYAQGYFNRGMLLMNEQNKDDAYNDFTMAIQLDPNYTDAYINRSLLLQSENNLEEAMVDCARAITLEPEYGKNYFARGSAYIKMKKFNEAFRDFTKMIQLKYDTGVAYYNRGIAGYYLGQIPSACADINIAVVAHVPNAETLFNKFCK